MATAVALGKRRRLSADPDKTPVKRTKTVQGSLLCPHETRDFNVMIDMLLEAKQDVETGLREVQSVCDQYSKWHRGACRGNAADDAVNQWMVSVVNAYLKMTLSVMSKWMDDVDNVTRCHGENCARLTIGSLLKSAKKFSRMSRPVVNCPLVKDQDALFTGEKRHPDLFFPDNDDADDTVGDITPDALVLPALLVEEPSSRDSSNATAGGRRQQQQQLTPRTMDRCAAMMLSRLCNASPSGSRFPDN